MVHHGYGWQPILGSQNLPSVWKGGHLFQPSARWGWGRACGDGWGWQGRPCSQLGKVSSQNEITRKDMLPCTIRGFHVDKYQHTLSKLWIELWSNLQSWKSEVDVFFTKLACKSCSGPRLTRATLCVLFCFLFLDVNFGPERLALCRHHSCT